jgi:glycyl-tRNA synthetase beta chain
MPDFLLELFSEEIPARMQARAAEDLQRLVTARLDAEQLTFEAAESHAAPRRLVLSIAGLAASQPTRTVETKGPRVGAPAQAIEGFLRSAGLESLDACEQRDTGKGVFYFALKTVTGRPVEDVLAGLMPEILDQFPWPKSMRWANHQARWVRPLRNILALLVEDGTARVVPIRWSLDRGGEGGITIEANALTYGHRFLAPGAIEVTSFQQYREALIKSFVILDRAERKAKIVADGAELVEAEGLRVKHDPELLDEVTGLAEWPVVRLGRIEPRFMELPPEVLTTSMRTHQKYFACERQDGTLAPNFVVVANNVARDGGTQIVAGNERVLRARLSDAQFFWDQDRQHTLESRLPQLDARIFHARLGTVGDKVRRMEALAEVLVPHVKGADLVLARRAIHLAKADLSSALVGEFPELQGVMGRYLALNDREPAEVAEAIAKHYAPVGVSDSVPTTPVAIVAALADKIDTLAGFFAVDEKPTGSKDPYALRRAALGIIRIILENGLRLPLGTVFGAALDRLGQAGDRDAVSAALMDFFADRLKVALREEGVRHDLITAVFALGGEDDLVRLVARVRALQDFLQSEDGANLLTAYRRAFRIVQIEEKKDAREYRGAPDPAGLDAPEEIALAGRLAEVGGACGPLLAAEDYRGTMAVLAGLRGPVDAFFERVTVNAEDKALRENRLRLLSRIWMTLNQVADFSRIEG